MTPVGYMYKTICSKPEWLKAAQVEDLYSVCSCFSEDFADWVNFWKHNGYWFFDRPEIIEELAQEHGLSLAGMKLFFYQGYEKQWADDHWQKFSADDAFPTNVVSPRETTLEGYDIVSFSCQTSAECSPLSCNHMAEEIPVNAHCLLDSFDKARHYVETGRFKDCEPGPYRIFAVYSVTNQS